jgi:tRNA(Met) cytidine acetyltransferase
MLAGQRFSVFCHGDSQIVRQQITAYLSQQPALRCLWLAEHSELAQQIISQTQANQFLGQEVDVLVFDASEICRPDALAAALGTLRGGGLFFMLLPETTQSLWLKRFIRLAKDFAEQSEQAIFWRADQPWPKLPLINPRQQTDFQLTSDQQTVRQAIEKVVHGHRRRPLLVTADRGRGKSAILGIAAADFLKQGAALRVLVTAPSKQSVTTLFEHAASQSEWLAKQLRFIAPDELLETLPAADLLLVDEAAALPQPLLQQLLQHYPRLVFASTLHGYEGAGLGFKYQFAKHLNVHTLGWQSVTLSEPVRWSADDPLEKFSYQALLLAAELTGEPADLQSLSQLTVSAVTSAVLAEDEALLQSVYALLVAAHYRTRPSDLQALLDDTDRTLYVLKNQQQLLGVCWLNQEGPLTEDLALAVHQGQRRLKGSLLPQSLLAHAGQLSAATLNYQRIIRIAICPALQQQGLGSYVLEALTALFPADTDVVGCSFAFQQDIYRFWLKNGYLPVRLGLHEDTVSAGRAVVMLRAVTEKGAMQITALQQRLAEQWPVLLCHYFANLPAVAVLSISQSLPLAAPSLNADDRMDIESFIDGQRELAFSFVPLTKLVWRDLKTTGFARCDEQHQQLLIQVFLQQLPLTEICQQHQLNGRKALLAELRLALRCLRAD